MKPPVITFFGNCQAEALARRYREFCVTDAEADVSYVGNITLLDHDPRRAEGLRRIAASDILVEQIFDLVRAPEEHIPERCKRIPFPTATSWFLWPYSGSPHPLNSAEPGDGPYPAELGDAFLNRMLKAEISPRAAAQRYVALDIVAKASIASRYEKELELLQRRDESARTGICEFMVAQFRTKRLLLSRGHPKLDLFALQLRHVFRQLGAAAEQAEAALRSLSRAPFPPQELPIHPRIGDYFGLPYAASETRHVYYPEGDFTFEEFAVRYMKFQFNHSARRLLSESDLPAARRLKIAEQALRLSPDSAALKLQYAQLLFPTGNTEAALQAARSSCDMEPADAEAWTALATMQAMANMRRDAETSARKALTLHAEQPAANKLVGHIALLEGRPAVALPYLRAATLYSPRDTEAWSLYADALRCVGDLNRAALAATRAATVAPAAPPWQGRQRARPAG